MVSLIYCGSYTNSIYTLAWDPETSSLTLAASTDAGFHPSWIIFHPADRSIVLTDLEAEVGQIAVLKYDSAGNGKVIEQVPSEGADPCHIAAAGGQLLVSNYSGETFTTIPLSDTPPYLSQAGTSVQRFSGTGPNPDRQEKSHPHQAYVHPDREELLLPDLGTDETRRFKKDPSGAWVLTGVLKYAPGSGPRHVLIYKGFLYTLLELGNAVTVHKLPPLPAEPTLVTSVQTISAFPKDVDTHPMFASEILIPPPNATFAAPYVYVTNRNDTHPAGDAIGIFSIADPDKLERVGEVRTGLRHLRGMQFGGPDDKWLIVGGVYGPGVKIFERVDGGKSLKELAFLAVEAPTGFLWV
ncbi:putative isomerase YbhE [Amylocystis lapponica]|nr:putative isomerase YbhE [Amylocystis lapponica]